MARVSVRDALFDAPTRFGPLETAKIILVKRGSGYIQTSSKTITVWAGQAIALGERQTYLLSPHVPLATLIVRMSERFLRSQMSWQLPDIERVRPGAHPSNWDGSALVLDLGQGIVHETSVIWREVGRLWDHQPHSVEVAAVRTVAGLARITELTLPALLANYKPSDLGAQRIALPGAATDRVMSLLRAMADAPQEPWTLADLARRAHLSRSQLCRLFSGGGLDSPMRTLNQIRTEKFAQFLLHSELGVREIAQRCGWNDPRVAARWFRARYSMSPSEYRVAHR